MKHTLILLLFSCALFYSCNNEKVKDAVAIAKNALENTKLDQSKKEDAVYLIKKVTGCDSIDYGYIIDGMKDSNNHILSIRISNCKCNIENKEIKDSLIDLAALACAHAECMTNINLYPKLEVSILTEADPFGLNTTTYTLLQLKYIDSLFLKTKKILLDSRKESILELVKYTNDKTDLDSVKKTLSQINSTCEPPFTLEPLSFCYIGYLTKQKDTLRSVKIKVRLTSKQKNDYDFIYSLEDFSLAEVHTRSRGFAIRAH